MSTLGERNEKVKAVLSSINNRLLCGEVKYYLSIAEDDGDPADYYDALTQAEQYAERNGDRVTLVAARKALIQLGVYREVTKHELLSTVCLRNGKQTTAKCDFRFKGKMYLFAEHLS